MAKARPTVQDDGLRYGEGFIETRTRADGSERYVARWYAGDKLRAKTFKERSEAKRHLLEIASDKRMKSFVPNSDLTVREVVRDYLDSPARDWKAATLYQYELMFRNYISPKLGSMKVVDLSPNHVQRWVDEIVRGGKSPQYVAVALSVLSGALKEAVRLEIVPRNVALGTKLKHTTPDYVTWTKAEARRVLDVIAQDPERTAMYSLLLATGMRIGEMNVLRWSAIDWKQGSVTIAATVTRVEGGRMVEGKTTKTGKPRKVLLPPETLEALRRHRARQNEQRLAATSWAANDYIFPGRGGELSSTERFRWIHRQVVAEAGVPSIRIHDIRHSFATHAFADDEHPAIVSMILGHHSPAYTLKRYTHPTTEDQARSVNRVSRSLFGPEVEDEKGTEGAAS